MQKKNDKAYIEKTLKSMIHRLSMDMIFSHSLTISHPCAMLIVIFNRVLACKT